MSSTSNPIWYLTYMWQDLAKDFGGKDPTPGKTPEEKMAYSTFIVAVAAALAIGGLVAFFPWGGIPGGLLFARKLQLLLTNHF